MFFINAIIIMIRTFFAAILILLTSIPAVMAQTGFCKSCAQMDNNQRTAEIRKMYSETSNNKNLTTKKYQYEFDENGQGFPYSFVFRYDNGKLVQIDFETEYDYIHRRFFYVKDCCLYFVLV